MLAKIITQEFIKVQVDCKDWKEAIENGVAMLEEKGIVEKSYKEEIFKNFENLGPYMVIAPGIVLSHARPEAGVNKTGMSIMTLKNPIKFGSELNDPVTLVLTLAAKDNTGHVSLLSKLMEMLMNSKDLDMIFNAKSVEDVSNIIKKYK
ncbi:PTS sugar transporter subunit IIA [Clostridium gasigenes]|uniref:PTS sugar transporter subunit IIA n=1 Tax=Clostridium gasigenes TaxID=94869 RepID=UPI001C0C01DA|nr:PTS sugar transporter subunit IIA [Clostridium gasigenes]MBU3107931.1 PTS sugar transporter subunit IIA [Clostridium gasigenes]